MTQLLQRNEIEMVEEHDLCMPTWIRSPGTTRHHFRFLMSKRQGMKHSFVQYFCATNLN
jgi:hypothetical protein